MHKTHLEQLNPKEHIIIKGARVNNLKNLDVAIPRNKLVVITGLSGSGKSSLAFDTLFAEGQRTYVESLSTYARQFLGRMEEPAVTSIRGISPAIAINQKNRTKHPRSTVGTVTEIYDYLKLLYARIGVTYSPISGQRVTKDSVSSVVDYITQQAPGTKIKILAPLPQSSSRSIHDTLKVMAGKGFTRVVQGEKQYLIETLLTEEGEGLTQTHLYVLIDRLVAPHKTVTDTSRIADSVQTAFFEGEGVCLIESLGGEKRTFSTRFELDNLKFEVPSVSFFSFNNPHGACKTCEGFGEILGIDQDKVIPDQGLTVHEGAIAPWRSQTMHKWLSPLIEHHRALNFPIHKPYKELSEAQRRLLWEGTTEFEGINSFFQHLATNPHKVHHRIMLARYRGKTTCPSCLGTRIRPDAQYVKIDGQSITTLLGMPIHQLRHFFTQLTLDAYSQRVAHRLLIETRNRLDYLNRVGLGYLTLNRAIPTLSGGEHQRIKLATALGSTLVGTIYILDEPTVGLHPRDTKKLTDILVSLKALGNTVIVVEHEEMIMRAADQLIDIGPEAGSAGGQLIFQGHWTALKQHSEGHTARYLNGVSAIPIPKIRRVHHHALRIQGAYENNLRHIDVDIPLGILTVITGVSGSGKSTLVKKILYPTLANRLGVRTTHTGKLTSIQGDLDQIKHIDFIDQHPIGKSSRSNPSTYVKAYDAIRQLFAKQPLAQQRGYKPGMFSFNMEGGRCETCQGEGYIRVEMQFMADVLLTCEQCRGKRFKEEILEVKYQGKDIAEVLSMTVEESLIFFSKHPNITQKLTPLKEVGLGYIQLGQSSSSLSGGEAQRVKLAAYLNKEGQQQTLFIFDEPTTGLHVHDIQQLLKAINALIVRGNSVVIIEHNTEVIKCADWIIDLGPEGGEQGGEVMFSGTPETMQDLASNHTAKYLKVAMKKNQSHDKN